MAKKKRKSEATLQEHEAALKDAARSLPPVVVICGEEPYLRREALETLQAALRKKHPHMDVAVFRGPASQSESGLDLNEILSELNSGSLFAAEKLVVLRQADRVLFPTRGSGDTGAGASRKTPQDRLAEYLDAPQGDIWLVLECERLNRQFSLGKALHDRACVIPCPALSRQGDVSAWIRQTATQLGKTLEPRGVELLYTAHGAQLGTLHAELKKLALYVGDEPAIRAEDIEAFLSGSMELDVFGLTNAVEARDLAQALRFARRIVTHGTRNASGKKDDGASSAHRALHMLAGTLTSILLARIELDRGGTVRDIASVAKTSPWRAERLCDAAERYSVRVLRVALDAVARESHAAHDTGGDVAVSLERSVLACCRPAEAGRWRALA